ncbi:hypothetical protein PbB2_01548 [Candidatus Phycosocius bacilliformis]|uniref:Uncharacterized protein n=1 Tax=Candidatus Phycosocius bacilliformis TaxID=1445552 RepID=A0A2P2E9Z2_9PROT|nr:hypothetical protein [Candidatus Phycosocius bacilliformis]GBF57878.1 hypothetical protein PbB2_01548 [Candidatus Phycosocius bacilliformis]
MTYFGLQNLADRISKLEKKFIHGAARCSMAIHGDESIDLRIEVSSNRFCSLEVSITEHAFDLNIDGKIGESDLLHDDYDFYKMITSIVSGEIVIISRSFLNIRSSETFYLYENGIEYFNSSQISIPFVKKYSKEITYYYESYLQTGK